MVWDKGYAKLQTDIEEPVGLDSVAQHNVIAEKY